MQPLHEALRLIKRQTELENPMRRSGGIRVTEERELVQLRLTLTQYPPTVWRVWGHEQPGNRDVPKGSRGRGESGSNGCYPELIYIVALDPGNIASIFERVAQWMPQSESMRAERPIMGSGRS